MVVDFVANADKRIARLSQQFNNRPQYITFALRWMRNRNLLAMQSDKDGVFVLLHMNVYDQLVDDKLGKSTFCYP